MPPWHAVARSRTLRQRPSTARRRPQRSDRLGRRGRAAGEPREPRPPPSFGAGWTIGEPDLVIELPAEVTVPASGEVPYHDYVVDPGFEEDVWVRAAEARPGNRDVVHHIIVDYVIEDPLVRRRLAQLRARQPGAGQPRRLRARRRAPRARRRSGPAPPSRRQDPLPDALHADRRGRDRPLAPRPRLRRPSRRATRCAPASRRAPSSTSRRARPTSRSQADYTFARERAAVDAPAPAPARQELRVPGPLSRTAAKRSCSGCPTTTSAGRPSTSSPKPKALPPARG